MATRFDNFYHDNSKSGRAMHEFIARLFPICRSITGPGLRDTLQEIGRHIPLQMFEVPSGTPVYDWEVPLEWSIREAYIKDSSGHRIIDFRDSNLHVVNYSTPVAARLSWEQLHPHLYTLPDHPEWIPYRTSYYQENWGFCLTHRQFEDLSSRPHEVYDVVIDSTLAPGALSYGECYLPGAIDEEVLFSCHTCHPSLANDNLSAIAVAVELAGYVHQLASRHYSYRFLFAPGTIGAITWLSRNEQLATKIRHGLVLALLGDNGTTTYKRTRHGSAIIDRSVAIALRDSANPHEIRDFSPIGYDERQYGSPGFDLPVGCLMRTPNGEYPQYHTSSDNLDLVRPAALADSLSKCVAVVDILENNHRYWNTKPRCEPQLGKRGLYEAIGGEADSVGLRDAMLWVLNFSDGQHTLLEIAERSGLPFARIHHAAAILKEHGLLLEQEATALT